MANDWRAQYLAVNPDVAAAKVDPLQHLQQYGRAEGRQFFDPTAYLAANQDVAKAGVDAVQHYNQWGRNEGRAAPTIGEFDPTKYLEKYADVKAAGIDPTQHWQQYGQKEGREGGVVARDEIAKALMAQQGGGNAGKWYDPHTPTGGNPWKTGTAPSAWDEIAAAMKNQAENPYDQYFAARGPMSGSGDDMNWMNALQPGQGGASGALTGTGMNTTGFMLGGGQRHADPAYWNWTPGTGWGTDQHVRLLWEQLRQNNPFVFEQSGGEAGMAAGVAAGIGPGGEGSAGGGTGTSGGGNNGGGNNGNTSTGVAVGGGFAGGGIGSDAHYGNQQANSMVGNMMGTTDTGANAYAPSTYGPDSTFGSAATLGGDVASMLGTLGEEGDADDGGYGNAGPGF